MIVPLEAAVQAVAGAVASVGAAPPSARALVARHADYWRFERRLAADAAPFEFVFPVGALTPAGRSLAAVLLAALRRAPEMADAAQAAARCSGPGAVVGGFVRALEGVLTPEEVAAEAARREELVRRFVAHVGAVPGLEGGRPEPAERSAQALSRYDPGARRAEERALRRQRALMEATREAQALIASGADLGPGT